jgi:hypothetical protein
MTVFMMVRPFVNTIPLLDDQLNFKNTIYVLINRRLKKGNKMTTNVGSIVGDL